MIEMGTAERALQLARFGHCQSISEIVARLRFEGRVDPEMHLEGAGIRKQLDTIFKANRTMDGPGIAVVDLSPRLDSTI